VTLPTATPVARPSLEGELLTVAKLPLDELQCTVAVRSCVLPSLKLPVTVNCCFVPAAIDAVAGLTVSETIVAVLTVSVVAPLNDPYCARIVVVPLRFARAIPEPPLIEAILRCKDDQCTPVVSTSVLPSLKLPTAVNRNRVPGAILGFAGNTEIETKVAGLTVSVVEPSTPPNVAVITLVPLLQPVARPVLLMIATAETDELQLATLVMSCMLPSVKVPTAVNCCRPPIPMLGIAGATAMDARVAAVTVSVVELLTAPDVAVMVAVPSPALTANPEALSITATSGAEELQFTDGRSCVLPSLKTPVAVNCWPVPKAMLAFAGVMAIEVRTAGITVRVVDPLTAPEVAVIVTVPAARAASTPESLMLARLPLEELQDTAARFCVLPSLKVPVAVNCWLTPMGSNDESGNTSIATSVAAVMVSVADPLTDPELAEIVALPTATPIASPEPATLAIPLADELQVTEFVRSWELPSLKTPLAVNCWVVPAAMDADPGRTLIETSVAAVTFSVVEPETPPELAVIIVLPAPVPEASPEPLMVATETTVEVQFTLVNTCELPSLKVPVAMNCCPAPSTMVGANGVTVIDASVAAVTPRLAEPVIEPEVATTLAVPLACPVAMPEALTLTTPAGDTLQATAFVKSCVLPSVNVPIADRCSLAPIAMDELAGITVSETRAAGVTARLAEPVTAPKVAVMLVVPAATVLAAPAEVTVATAVADDVQLTELVRSLLLPSLYLPVAVNCCPRPNATDALAGETWIAVRDTEG
jgi:hypothetical protein